MATPLINLSDDSIFGNSQGDSAPRRGLSTSSQRVNLNDDAMFKTAEEARSTDVQSGKYVSIFDQEAKIEPPKRGIGRMIDDTITSVVGTNKANPEDIRPDGLAKVRQEAAQTEQQVGQRRAELGTDDPDRGYAMQTFDSAAAGMANMVGVTMEYAGRQFGIKKMEDLGKKAQVDAGALTPKEQDIIQKVAGGVGSALPIVAGGMLAGGGLLAAGAGTGVALAGASAVGAGLEAPSIAQEAFEGALKETGNEARAETQGYKAAALNLPISFIMNRIGIFGGGGNRAVQTGRAILAEGTEEGTQKALTNYLGYQPTGEGVSEDALVGGLTGGVLKQITYRPDAPESKPSQKPAGEETGNLTSEDTTGSPSEPVGDLPEGVQTLGFKEVYQTLKTKPAVAAVLYQEATTPEQKELVKRAVDRAEIQNEFQEALGDANLLNDTRQEMQSFPEFTDSLAFSLTSFVNDMPPANIFKAERRRAPSEQEVNSAFDAAWEDSNYVASLEAEAETIAAEREERQGRRPGFQANTQPNSEMEALVSNAEAGFTRPNTTEGMTQTEATEASLPESLRGARVNDGNRVLLEAYFEESLGTILPRNPSKTRTRALAKLQKQMEMVGFPPEQIQVAINTGSFDNASALADVLSPPTQAVSAPVEAPAERVVAPSTPAPATAPSSPAPAAVESFAPDAGTLDQVATQTQPADQSVAQTQEQAPEATEPRVNPEIQRAKDDVFDAAAELADVFADVISVRKNITGQQYTAKDLPPAIAKVMTRLADLGYVKFKDMVRELMKRMRANKDWAPLADQVTPFMLRQAYKKLPKFEGKEVDRDVDSVKGGEVATLISEGREKTAVEETKEAEDEVTTAGMSFTKVEPKKPVKKQAKAEQESDEVDTPAEYGLKEKYQLPKGKQASLGLGRFQRDDDTPQMKTLRGRLEGIVRSATQIKFFEDTILMLQKQITDVESKMKALDTLTVTEGGKTTTFRARDEEDENPGLWATNDMNAYDRFIDGQLPDKPTTKMALMDQRRMLVEELERVRDKSTASRARLYMRSMSRMMDQMMTVTQNAISAGMPADQARAVFGEFYQAIAFRDTKPAPEADTVEADQDQDAQVDAFEGAKVAMGIVSDFRNKQITQRQLDELIDRGVRDGDFTYMDVGDAFRAFNMSVPRGVMDTSSQLSVRKRLKDFMAENGNTTASRMEWMVNMEKVVKSNPGSLGTKFTAEEVAYYNMWKQDREALRSRRKVTADMRDGRTAEEAFPNLLFNRFRLSQVRNPDSIQESESTRTAVRAITGADPEATWFEDVAYALRRRPDLKDDIFESMTAEEGRLFNSWVDAKKRAIAQESRVLAKAPAFATLRNMDSIDASLDSQPGQPKSAYEDAYTQVVNAELSELPAVMDAIARLNSVLVGRVDPETGEILTDEQAEQYAADFVDSLAQRAMMGSVVSATGAEMSQFGASTGFGADAPAGLKRGEFGFGETVEDAGDAMRASGPQSTTDLTAEEQLQDEMISEADLMEAGREMSEAGTEEDTEGESDTAAEQETATEKEAGTRKAAVPSSLVAEQEYRFRRAPFSGELTNSIVAEHVLKIVSKWTGAPRINVVPNVQMLPEGIREQVMSKLSKDSGAAGLFVNGEVYIFSDHISSLSDAEFTLFHETYGHYGMRAFLGAKFDSFLELAYNTNTRIRAEADALMASKPIGKLEAIDEVLSDMAGANEPLGLVKQWLGKVITGLRQIGMNRVAGWMSAKTDAEIGYTLMMARKAVQEGAPTIFNGAPDEVRLAEARLPYEMFSSRDGNTTAYTRYNPITQTYAVFTATGNDIRKGWNTTIVNEFEDAIALMRKNGKVDRRLRSGLYIDNKIPSDLQKIPEFRIATDDLSLTTSEGLKNYGRLIKRNAIIFFQNEYKAVHEVASYLRSKGRMSDAFDPSRDLEGLHERRTAVKLENLNRRFVKPLLELAGEAGKLGANADTVNKYLVAKHAEERNKHIAKINKGMPDGGSGMKTKEAKDFLKSIQNEKFMPKLEEISALLKQLSDQKLAMMKESGLISHDEYMARAQYKNYVNLSGVKEGLDAFDDLAVLAGSSKFSTRKDKRALGRGDMATDVLARTIQSAEAAVLNASKNRVKQKILAMFEVNYDPDFVSINKQAYKRVLDENGEVTEKMDETYIRNKNVMVVHVNGRPVTIEFKKTGKGTFADAIHGAIYPSEADSTVARALGRYNRIVGQMLTTWNPVWVLVNFVRDAQTLYYNSVADKRVTKQMAKEMVKTIPSAMKATFHYATDGRRGNSADPDMIRAFREMREAGGATSFLNLQGLEKQVSAIEDMINPQKKSDIVKVGQFLADKLEEFNIPIELAPRLSAYKVMRDNGYSKDEAAQYAGEITVNFNMRGSSKFMRNMYLFFNPAVQGSAKLVKLASENPKTFSKIAMGMAAVGFISSVIGRAMGGEDEDGIDKLDKVPVFKRATTLILSPDVPGAAIPVPYGWNAFFAAGVFMADTLWAGSQPAATSAKRIAQAAFEGFSPIGSAGLSSDSNLGTVFKGLSPTAALPLLEIMLNENRFGAPIVKEAGLFGGGKRPNAEMAFDSASPISAGIFKGLNRATGGDYVNPGAIDVNPGIVDHLISSYIPGLVAESYKFASWATKSALGYDTKSASIPLVDRLTAKVPESYDYGMYRRAKEYVATKYDDFKLNPERRDKILAEFPGLGGAKGVLDTTDSRIQDLREYRKNVERDESMSREDKVKMINETRAREKEIVTRAVRVLLENSPALKPVLIDSE